MRKPIQFVVLVALAVLVVATGVLLVRLQDTTRAVAAAKASEQSTQASYARTVDAIAEIQDSLNAIAVGDTSVAMTSQMLQSEQQLSGPNKADALDRIALLRSSILRNKARINQLESSLKSRDQHIKGLDKLLAQLKRSVAEKEQQVADLTTRVDSLQTQVTSLATTVQQTQDTLQVRDQTIETKRREIATVFYVVGNKHDLTTKGVAVAKGGLLGIGKTLLPAPNPNEDSFTALDTDEQQTLDLNSAKAQVLSAQPTGSYELRLVDGKMQLHILNPVEFRKIKQLVIMTA